LRETYIEATTLGDLLDRQAARSDRELLVFPEERVRYRQLAAEAATAARALRALGVGPGDKVGLMLPASVDFMAALFGAAKLGALPVPINLRFKEVELSHVVRDGDLRVLLTSDRGREGAAFADLLRQVLPRLPDQDPRDVRLDEAPELRRVVLLGDPAPGFLAEAAFREGAETVDPDEVDRLQERVRIADVAMIMYTSGTEARPKGAMLTHEGLTRQAHLIARTRYGLGPEDRFWTPLPMFHIGGTIAMLACVSAGCTYCHVGWMDGGRALDQLERERCTVAFPAFDLLWLPVLDHPRFPKADLSALRLVQASGPPDVARRMQARLPRAVQIAGSGMTENSSYTSLGRPDDDEEARLRTHGHPVAGVELRCVDPETGRDLPPGERGELLVRGFARFAGYYKDEERTRAVIDPDGWFHTGDLCVIDAEGRHTFVGRVKDMLKVGGENVAAAEVEDLLSRHPSVALVQVVGAPDARYGEVPCAYVQLAPGATASEDELIGFCLGRIATFKVPRYVRFVEEWPTSGTKIRKVELRERIARELEERGITEAPKVEARAVASS
jgi:fatty-acyl-CoA synthase